MGIFFVSTWKYKKLQNQLDKTDLVVSATEQLLFEEKYRSKKLINRITEMEFFIRRGYAKIKKDIEEDNANGI